MDNEKKIHPEDEERPLKPGEVRLPSPKEVTLPLMEEAVPAPANKTIHPRRPLPIVPQKPETESD